MVSFCSTHHGTCSCRHDCGCAEHNSLIVCVGDGGLPGHSMRLRVHHCPHVRHTVPVLGRATAFASS